MKGQASPIQKAVWAAKKDKGTKDADGKENSPADPASKTTSTKSSDGKSTSTNSKSRDGKSSSSTTKSKSSSSKSNGSSSSSSSDRKWSGSGDDICEDAPKDWCADSSIDSITISSEDGNELCKDACNRKHSSNYCDSKKVRDFLGCDKMSSRDFAATKKLRGRA